MRLRSKRKLGDAPSPEPEVKVRKVGRIRSRDFAKGAPDLQVVISSLHLQGESSEDGIPGAVSLHLTKVKRDKGFYGWSGGSQKIPVEAKINGNVKTMEASATLDITVLRSPAKEVQLRHGARTIQTARRPLSSDIQDLKAAMSSHPEVFAAVTKHDSSAASTEVTGMSANLNIRKSKAYTDTLIHAASTHHPWPRPDQRNEPAEPVMIKLEVEVGGKRQQVELSAMVTLSLTIEEPFRPMVETDDDGEKIHTLSLVCSN